MSWGRIKSEHAGAKRGKGYWGRKAMAKQAGRRARRRADRAAAKVSRGFQRSVQPAHPAGAAALK